MIFKYALVSVLGYIFYKMVLPKKKIGNRGAVDEPDYTEYEELED